MHMFNGNYLNAPNPDNPTFMLPHHPRYRTSCTVTMVLIFRFDAYLIICPGQ